MARNGTEFGIRVAGTGNDWFAAPSEQPRGVYFPGFTAKDANPDIGDSAIVETIGLGGFAMATAPAGVSAAGRSVGHAVKYTRAIYDITVTRNPHFPLPPPDLMGGPAGTAIPHA